MASYKNNIGQSLAAVLLLLGAAVYALIGIASSPDGTTITNEAISTYLFKTGQRITSQSNMTETIVQSASIAAVLELTLSAEQLVGNGIDSCSVTAMIYDGAGNPVPDGQPVAFTTSQGKFSNGSDTTYTLTTQGQAVAWLKSELIAGGVPIVARIGAMTYGASGQSLTKELPMIFYAGGVTGKIMSAPGRVVPGIIVVAYDGVRAEMGRDTTEAGGAFFIPIEESGEYTIAFRYRNAFNDDVVLYAPASVQVPATGGVQAVAPLNTIVGNLLDEATGQPVRKSGVSVMLYRTNTNSPNNGRTTPALQFTDDRGLFAFDSLAPGASEVNVIDVQLSGKLAVTHSEPGTFVIDANIAVADIPTFEVTKNSNKRIVEIGDVVSYHVEVRNTSADVMLSNVWLVDELPSAFVFAKGSTYRDGAHLPDPTDNRHARWFVADSLLPGSVVKVSYSVNVGAGALGSNGVNKAYAVATLLNGDTARTAVASVQVVVRPGVFTDRGIVIGKIFYDANENANQDEGEHGIAGVELWMEDGTRILTGDDGKYSLPEVRPGQHVMRVNDLTLSYGSELLALTSEFAGDGLTRFVLLTEGGIARTDFYVRAPHQAALEATYARSSSQSVGEPISALYTLTLYDIGTPNRISLVDTLPQGFYFDMNSITWRGMKLFPQGKYARTLWVDFPKRLANSSDTVLVTIVGDSSAVGTPLASNGKLVLVYQQGRDAIFAAHQKYHDVEPVVSEQAVPLATQEAKEVQPDTVVQTQPAKDTVSQQMKVPDTTHIAAVGEQKKLKKKSGVKRKAAPVKAPAREPLTVEQAPQQQSAPVPNTTQPAVANRELNEDSIHNLAAIGLTVFGIVAFLLLLFVLRRRKEEGENYGA